MPLLDFYAAALHLGVRRLQLKRFVAAGQIPHASLPDGTVMFDEADLDAWLRNLPRNRVSPAPTGSGKERGAVQ